MSIEALRGVALGCVVGAFMWLGIFWAAGCFR